MKRAAALGALLGCAATSATVRAAAAPGDAPAGTAPARPATAAEAHAYHFPPRPREFGLRLGAALPFCNCSPGFGPTARLQILWPVSRAFKLGVSAGFALFRYSSLSVSGRVTATTSSARLLMRAYPVMGRRAGLYFDLGIGLAYATMYDPSSGTTYSTFAPTLGIGAGLPIVVTPWLRLGPYGAALVHVSSFGESCDGTHSCPPPEPDHFGFVGFGLEATALFGP